MSFQTRNIEKIIDYLNILRTDGGIGGNGLNKKPFTPLQRKLLSIYLNLRVLFTGKPSIFYMDFDVTTHCTLNCKDCCHAMPIYKNTTHVLYNFAKFKTDLNLLLQSIDIIYDFEFLGGEPLLTPELDKMIQYAQTKKQIKHLTMYTNGTIIPSEKVLNAMSNVPDFLLCISNYSSNPNLSHLLKHDEIISLCQKYGIHYYLFPADTKWIKTNPLYKRDRTQQEIEKEWNHCWQRDNLVFCDGKLYPCQKALAIDKNISPISTKYETVDFRRDKQANKSLIKFFSLPYMNVCDYCKSDATQLTKPAQQKSR